MEDPYKLLGIDRSATDDEITRAYRNLAKKYHPDINPGNAYAEKKMKDINAAYESIKNKTAGTGGGQQYGSSTYQQSYSWEDIFGQNGPFGEAFDQARRQNRASNMQTVYVYLLNRQYYQALRVLNGIDEHNAEWHYYSALAHAGLGNRASALNHASEAVRLDPYNEDYGRLLTRLEENITSYRRAGSGFGVNFSSVGRAMAGIWIANLFAFVCCRFCC